MKFLFIFMDGVGLGRPDPEINPFAQALLPNMDALLDGHKIATNGSGQSDGGKKTIVQTSKASLIALDACLGVEGLPQSATGQASILTGENVAAMLGMHDGPKPNPEIMEILKKGTLFSQLYQHDQGATLLNAYPPRYFNSIERGHRLPGVIALSAIYAQMRLRTKEDLFHGEALSADLTALGWREHLGFPDTPTLDLPQVGKRLSDLSDHCALSFFEYWNSDIAGHHQDMAAACTLLEQLDTVISSLVEHWNADDGLILITSDHGNMEDLSTRRHTRNDVPLVLIGSSRNREVFINQMNQAGSLRKNPDLTDIAPAILNLV